MRTVGEQRWKTHGDPSHRRESQAVFVFSCCLSHLSKPRRRSTLPPQPLVLLPTANNMQLRWVFVFFLFCFYCSDLISLGLWERLCLWFEYFHCILWFCSDFGMLYFVTFEIKKHEREWRTKDKMDEIEKIFFYSTGYYYKRKLFLKQLQ